MSIRRSESCWCNLRPTVPVTVTVMVQVAAAATLPPESATLPAPATAVTVPSAACGRGVGHGGKRYMDPAAYRSSATPVRLTAPAAVFATVMVSTDVPVGAIDTRQECLRQRPRFGAFAMVSGAVAGAGLEAPSVVVTPPVGIVFVYGPPTHGTRNVHRDGAGRTGGNRSTRERDRRSGGNGPSRFPHRTSSRPKALQRS